MKAVARVCCILPSSVVQRRYSNMKTYSNLVGYFTGISWIVSPYSIPFVMYHTGMVAGLLTLLVILVASFIPVMWILEIMCRAEVSDQFISTINN